MVSDLEVILRLTLGLTLGLFLVPDALGPAGGPHSENLLINVRGGPPVTLIARAF